MSAEVGKTEFDEPLFRFSGDLFRPFGIDASVPTVPAASWSMMSLTLGAFAKRIILRVVGWW